MSKVKAEVPETTVVSADAVAVETPIDSTPETTVVVAGSQAVATEAAPVEYQMPQANDTVTTVSSYGAG